MAGSAGAQVSLSVSKQASKKIPLALAELDGIPSSDKLVSAELTEILRNNLQISGYFTLLLGQEKSVTPQFPYWLRQGAEAIVINKVITSGKKIQLTCYVYSVTKGQLLFKKKYRHPANQKREMMHLVSEDLIKELTGKTGLGTSRISFVSNRSGNKQIYVVDWDGHHLIQLTKGKNISIYPKWSERGPKILCTDYTNRLPHIFELDLVKNTKRPVSERPGLNAFARYSPDGKKIALTLSRDGNPEIYTFRSDGTELKRLTRSRGVDSSPCWTPDGKKIVFVSDRSGTPQIYWMNADGTRPQRLTRRGSYNTSPEVSPDGNLIAYCSSIRGRFQIFVLDPKTKESVQITQDRLSNEDPTWGPSSRHLAYSATKNYQSDIYILDIYDGQPLRLTRNLKDCSSPSWSRSFY